MNCYVESSRLASPSQAASTPCGGNGAEVVIESDKDDAVKGDEKD